MSMGGIESLAIQYSKGGTVKKLEEFFNPWVLKTLSLRLNGSSPHIFSIHHCIYLGFITGIIQIFPSPKCANISYYFFPGFCVFDLKCNLHAYLEKDRDWNRFTEIQELYTISHNSAILFCLYCELLVYLCTGK